MSILTRRAARKGRRMRSMFVQPGVCIPLCNLEQSKQEFIETLRRPSTDNLPCALQVCGAFNKWKCRGRTQ